MLFETYVDMAEDQFSWIPPQHDSSVQNIALWFEKYQVKL